MMHHRSGARPDFRRRHPGVPGESGRDHDVDVAEGIRGWDSVAFRNLKDFVGADVPPFPPSDGRWLVLSVARRGAGIDPSDDLIDVRRAETPVIHKMAELGIG